MNKYHKNLTQEKWNSMRFVEQMAHVGSEVERALNWKGKNNPDYSMRAFERALELIDLCLSNTNNNKRFKEIARTRESLVDYFCYSNEFGSSPYSFQKYFYYFAYAARKHC